MANPRTPSPAPGAWDISTPTPTTPGGQQQYVMSKQERLNQIAQTRAEIKLLTTKIDMLNKWIAACKPLNQFNNGTLLSRLSPYDYAHITDADKNELYVWISEKDRNYINSNNPPAQISPDFSTRVLSNATDISKAADSTFWLFNAFPFQFGGPTGKTLYLFSKTMLSFWKTQFNDKIIELVSDLNTQLDTYKKYYGTLPPTTTPNNSNNSKNSSNTKSADTTTPTVTYIDIRNKQTLYNAPSVIESYYPSNLFKAIKPSDSTKLTPEEQVPLFNGNIPSKVVDAKQLWESALGSKGMFQVSTQMPENTNYTSKNIDSTKPDITLSYDKYGFQFLYNPSTIEMAYMGIAQTDMSMYTSGKEAFNLVPPTNTSATVSFDILINRMNDMKYYTPSGTLTAKGKIAYPQDHVPNAKEQKQIYNMGTMYDVEYLLKTLLGYTMKSYLRNNMETADMGWFSKRPVELHLGKNLRYLGYVGGVSLRHAIFDERMVPLFTTVHIEFSRIPDYSNVDTSNNKTGSGLGGLTAL
jgi:hypothetical protein